MGNSDKHSNWPIPTVIVGGGNGKMKLGGQHIALDAADAAGQCAPDAAEQVRHRTGQVCRQHRRDFRALTRSGSEPARSVSAIARNRKR